MITIKPERILDLVVEKRLVDRISLTLLVGHIFRNCFQDSHTANFDYADSYRDRLLFRAFSLRCHK